MARRYGARTSSPTGMWTVLHILHPNRLEKVSCGSISTRVGRRSGHRKRSETGMLTAPTTRRGSMLVLARCGSLSHRGTIQASGSKFRSQTGTHSTSLIRQPLWLEMVSCGTSMSRQGDGDSSEYEAGSTTLGLQTQLRCDLPALGLVRLQSS